MNDQGAASTMTMGLILAPCAIVVAVFVMWVVVEFTPEPASPLIVAHQDEAGDRWIVLERGLEATWRGEPGVRYAVDEPATRKSREIPSDWTLLPSGTTFAFCGDGPVEAWTLQVAVDDEPVLDVVFDQIAPC